MRRYQCFSFCGLRRDVGAGESDREASSEIPMATTKKKVSPAESGAKGPLSRAASAASVTKASVTKASVTKASVTKPSAKEAAATKSLTAKASSSDLKTKAASAARGATAPQTQGAKREASPPRAGKMSGKVSPRKAAEGDAALDREQTPSIAVGSKAPTFSLKDQTGKVVHSASLKGQPYVVYFYPRDNTPGCTQEACDFRDDWSSFETAGVRVFGVSPDSEKSHEGFVSKYRLPFTLLSDPDKALAQAYGAWALKKNYGREFWGIVRSTFLIGSDGKVRRVWRNVKVAGHTQAVLAEARAS